MDARRYNFVLGREGKVEDFGILVADLGNGFCRVGYATMVDRLDIREVSVRDVSYLSEDSDAELIGSYMRILRALDDSYIPFKVMLNGIGELSRYHVEETGYMVEFRGNSEVC